MFAKPKPKPHDVHLNARAKQHWDNIKVSEILAPQNV